jgi:CRP-like cAMP-binding protein
MTPPQLPPSPDHAWSGSTTLIPSELAEARERAAVLLVTDSALADLPLQAARAAVGYMHFRRLPAGTVLIQQGDWVHNDYMLLIVDGEVSVDLDKAGRNEQADLTLTVSGPGSIVGMMGMLDGDARSATVVALNDLLVAELDRAGLARMLQAEPALTAHFLLAISTRVFDRLRQVTRQLRVFDSLNRTLMAQLDEEPKPKIG